MPVDVEDAPREGGCRGSITAPPAAADVCIEAGLYGPEQVRFDDGGMLARVCGVSMRDLAEVEPVAQEMEEGAAAEGVPAHSSSGSGGPGLRDDAGLPQALLQGMDGPEFEIGGEYLPD